MIIAIDGYSGCYKSRLSGDLARALNLPSVHTGNCYRVLTAAWVESGRDMNRWLREIDGSFVIGADGTPCVQGRNYRSVLRSTAVDVAVCDLAAQFDARRIVTETVRSFADGRDIIVEGRDVGTEVFPDARHKLFLTTGTHEMIAKWAESNRSMSDEEAISCVRNQWGDRWVRDYRDMVRTISPVRPAADAWPVDVEASSYEEMFSRVEAVVHPRVSFVVPFFNSEGTLQRCLRAIVASCSLPYEVIFADDGSEDGGRRIVRDMIKGHANMLLVEGAHNGVSAARNLALEKTCGDCVVFCDADDEMLPRGADRLVESLGAQVKMSIGFVRKRHSPRMGRERTISAGAALRRFFRSDRTRLLGTVYGKAFLRTAIAGLRFDEELNIGEDALFLLQALKRVRRVALVPDAVYRHNANPDGLLGSAGADGYESAMRASARMMQSVQGNCRLVRLAARDAWNVFWRCCMRCSGVQERERFYELLCQSLDAVGVSLSVRNVDLYGVVGGKFVRGCRCVTIGRMRRYGTVSVNGRGAPFYVRPGFVNMHVHLGDYNYGSQLRKYDSLEQFLVVREGMRTGHAYEEAVSRNVLRGIARGDSVFCYASHSVSGLPGRIVRLRKHGRLQVEDDGVFIADATQMNKDQLLSVMVECKERSVPVFMHISSSRCQDLAERAQFGGSLVRLLDECGLLNRFVYLVHGSHLREDELTLVGFRGAKVVLCPLANSFISENGVDPKVLDEHGVQWLLGSDSHFITGESSVSASARYLLHHGYAHAARLFEGMTSLPLELSKDWRHPLGEHYFLILRGRGERMSVRAMLENYERACYSVAVYG